MRYTPAPQLPQAHPAASTRAGPPPAFGIGAASGEAPRQDARAMERWRMEAVAAERRQLLLEKALMAERLRGAALETAVLTEVVGALGLGLW
jgi:hypothetical protein